MNKKNIIAIIVALGVVIVLLLISVFSNNNSTEAHKIVQKVEKVMRYGVATIFIVVGIYYLQYLVKYIINL